MKKINMLSFVICFLILSCERDTALTVPEHEVFEMIDQMHTLGVTSYTKQTVGNETSIKIKSENYHGFYQNIMFKSFDIKLVDNQNSTFSISTYDKSGSLYLMKIDIENGNIELEHNSNEEEFNEENSMISSFLLINFIEQTNNDLPRFDRASYSDKVNRAYKEGRAAPSDGCKKTTAAISVTRSDAAISASSTSPGDSCSKSGEPGCVCATGIWGGDIGCACIQVWNCSDPVTCLNVN